MRQRLFLLKDQGSQDLSWISALEETMVSRGAAIAAARVDLLNRLLPIVRDGIELFPGASLMLDGDLELWLKNSPALGVEEQFRKILVTNRYKDGSSGRTQCGVHLTDMVVYHKEKNQEASFCSTGEQKALLISIILAHAKARSISIGAVPLLLFDEIAAHLDEERREALFSHLENLGGQTWFTGTEENIFQKISKRAQLLRVANGKISYV
jgi:DNA replication and repair protein RecF